MGFLWDFYGISMGFLWYFYGMSIYITPFVVIKMFPDVWIFPGLR